MSENKFKFLEGNTVIQVKVSRYQLILELDKAIEISIESEISITSSKSASEYSQGDFSQIQNILELLEKTVKSVDENESEVKITFDNDCVLSLPVFNSGHESFVVTNGSETHVVGE